jgi:hypothetical protein
MAKIWKAKNLNSEFSMSPHFENGVRLDLENGLPGLPVILIGYGITIDSKERLQVSNQVLFSFLIYLSRRRIIPVHISLAPGQVTQELPLLVWLAVAVVDHSHLGIDQCSFLPTNRYMNRMAVDKSDLEIVPFRVRRRWEQNDPIFV